MYACARNRVGRIGAFVLALCAVLPRYAPAAEMRDLIGQVDVYSTTGEEVLALFGQPLKYLWGQNEYTSENLPQNYIMRYPEDINFWIADGKVREVRFENGPDWYVFGNNIRIGSTEEDVFAELGQPVRVLDGTGPRLLNRTLCRWGDGYSHYCCGDRDVRIFFVRAKVTSIYLWPGGGGSNLQQNTLSAFVDVRGVDLRNIDLSQKISIIATLTFDGRTQWPLPEKLPEDFNAQGWIETGMNPGFKIRTLHEQGITGKGVSIGVIAGAANTNHSEFAQRIAWYLDLASSPDFRQPGTAIAGLLAGANCGVAPGAELYYCAVKPGASESEYVEALARLIEMNKSLPAENKIKLVCVPASPDDGVGQSKAGEETWDDACTAAELGGMLILDGTHRHGIIRECSYDAAAPDDITLCIPGAPDKTPIASPNNLYAPTSPRTVPESVGRDNNDYAFYGRGDSSWSIPYCAGVLALGRQLNPRLTGEEMLGLMYKTAYATGEGAKVIYPLMFVTEVAKTAHN